MADLKYQPVPHNHQAFLEQAMKHQGFMKAHEGLAEEYATIREKLAGRPSSYGNIHAKP